MMPSSSINQAEGDHQKTENQEQPPPKSALEQSNLQPLINPIPLPPLESSIPLLNPATTLPQPMEISEPQENIQHPEQPENNLPGEDQKISNKRIRKSVSDVSDMNEDSKDLSKAGKVPGRWSQEEHKKFIEGILVGIRYNSH